MREKTDAKIPLRSRCVCDTDSDRILQRCMVTLDYLLDDSICEEIYGIGGDKSQNGVVQVYMLARLSLGS